jgi:hypothetical protein
MEETVTESLEPLKQPEKRGSSFTEAGALLGVIVGIVVGFLIDSTSMVTTVGVILLIGAAGVAVGALLDWLIRGRGLFLGRSLRRGCFEIGTFTGLVWGILVVLWKSPKNPGEWFIALSAAGLAIIMGAGVGLVVYFVLSRPGNSK